MLKLEKLLQVRLKNANANDTKHIESISNEIQEIKKQIVKNMKQEMNNKTKTKNETTSSIEINRPIINTPVASNNSNETSFKKFLKDHIEAELDKEAKIYSSEPKPEIEGVFGTNKSREQIILELIDGKEPNSLTQTQIKPIVLNLKKIK